jgi:chromosome partitioning protein
VLENFRAIVHNCKKEHMHMRTIAMSINKGGVGKTTTTKTLACAAAQAGLNALMLDMDTQQNATNWGRRREKQDRPLPLVRFATEQDLPGELERAAKAGCDIALIDTPPGRSSEAMAAVEAADFVLIPFWNDQDSYDGVTKTAGLVRRLGKEAYGLLNFVTPNSRSHEEAAREVLKAIGLPMAPVVLHRYDVHRLASIKGLAAQEMEPESSAALEIAALWDWLSATLQLSKSAVVHKGAA